MARLIFPSDRLVYLASATAGSAFLSASGETATVYSDSAGTVLADVQNLDTSANAAAVFTVDATSRLPLFLGQPDGGDTLYIKVGTGPVTPIYALTPSDVSAAVAAEASARASGDATNGAAVTAEATARANADTAETTARAAGDTAGTAALTTHKGSSDHDNHNDARYDATGAAAAAQAAAIAASAQRAANLSDLGSASTARTNLGLGTAATHATSDYDAAGAAATAQTAAAADATSKVATHTAATDPHADRAYTDTKVAALVNSAPAILDTLGEIATQLQSDESVAGALATTVANETTRATAAEATKAQKLVRTAVKTANYTAAAGDLVPCDTTSGPFTVTLPNAPAVGSRVAVKLVTLGAGNAVTIACAGSDVFNKTAGATSGSLTLLNQALQVQYDTGGIWTVVADDITKSSLDATYVPVLTDPATYTWNTDGTVATMTVQGVTTTFTYNADGTPATEVRSGVTRSYTWNADGTLASVA